MGAQVLSMSMSVVDNVVVGRLGRAPLAAMAMGVALYSFAFVIAIGLLSAVSPLVSSLVGAGQPERVGPTVHRGLLLSIVLAGGMVYVFHVSDHVLLALGQDPALVPLARQFLVSAAWGAPAVTGFVALRQFTEGVSDTRPSMIISGVAALLNPLVDITLILGWGPFHGMGLQGAGYALAVPNWLMVTLMLGYLRLNPRYRQYRFWDPADAPGRSLRDILRLGLPLSGSLLSEVSFFASATLLMGTLGTRNLAAHQIALNACSFAFMVPLGLSMAIAIRVSEAVGRGDMAGARRAGHSGALLTLITQAISATCFLLLAHAIVRLYTGDEAVVETAAGLLRIGGFFQLFDGLQVVGMGMLRGVMDTRVPFIASLLSYWVVGVAAGLFMTFRLHWGPVGLWYGMVVGLGCAALAHQWRFQRVTAVAR